MILLGPTPCFGCRVPVTVERIGGHVLVLNEHRVVHQCVVGDYGRCWKCGESKPLPLGRPDRQGNRRPLRFCAGCLPLPRSLEEQRESRRIAKRRWRARRRAA